MSQLTSLGEASRRYGISRQTLRNWIDRGIIDAVVPPGKKGFYWVDTDILDAMKDSIRELDAVRASVEKERKELKEERKRLTDDIDYLRSMSGILGRYGNVRANKRFYHAIVEVASELRFINPIRADTVNRVIEGETMESIGADYGITSQAVSYNFVRGCRDISRLRTLKDLVDEARELRERIRTMRITIQTLQGKAETYRKADAAGVDRRQAEEIKALATLLSTPINKTELSIRAVNCLYSLDVNTVGDMVRLKKVDILSIRNLGRRTFGEISDFIEENKLSFGYDVDSVYEQLFTVQD